MALFEGMQYNTLQFLMFLGLFLVLFYIVPKNWMKLAVIIMGNLFFYYSVAGWQELLIVCITALVVFAFARCIDRLYTKAEENKPDGLSLKKEIEYWEPVKKKGKGIMLLGITLVLCVLFYVKAGRILHWESVESLSELTVGKILVPLGLSYYTFSSVGYIVDVYKRKIKATQNFFTLFACISFFPIIIEGPISRYEKLIGQFENIPKPDYDRFCRGMQRFLWGLFKKIVIADRISAFSTTIFGSLDERAGIELVLAVIINMFNMYTDFSGCMDMVIGMSEAMGITLEENFQQPFFSQSVPEFWRRWHMTLCAWFRDYVYMPIVRSSWMKKLNKKARNRFDKHLSESLTAAIPMFIVWLITGLWHGTGAAYIIWGLYWGMLMFLSMICTPYIEKFNQKCKFRTETFGWKLFRMVRTDFLYCIAGTIATVGSAYGVRSLLVFVKGIFEEHRFWNLFNGTIFEFGMTAADFAIAAVAVALLCVVDAIGYRGIDIREKIKEQPVVFRWLVWLGLIFLILTWGRYGYGYDASAFIYKGF